MRCRYARTESIGGGVYGGTRIGDSSNIRSCLSSWGCEVSLGPFLASSLRGMRFWVVERVGAVVAVEEGLIEMVGEWLPSSLGIELEAGVEKVRILLFVLKKSRFSLQISSQEPWGKYILLCSNSSVLFPSTLRRVIVWFNAGSTPREGFGLRQYNYDELAEATDKFSNRNFLGEGGFSLVYEGILDGKKVAIKKLKIRPDERSQSEEESKEEIKVISRVSHKNLVKLLGYCIEGDDILLILEYVPKKSLKHHLHGETTLEWTKRMKIAIGTAKGLEYLHENCTPKIIHRDVKAENILIDDKYEPKIADFGLALLFPETGSPTHITRSNKGTQADLPLWNFLCLPHGN
ncbi:proline-rich receptor-like protein kinase PERK13 [Hevea brasiliensis]|uniref:proline-rich receptor-like protein kinase PERK13 n=1 Tax=Hevea brasiliensis TaxID=3981 RepID=UPI0025E07481|nr:proline-rich receptor-like protein kinase PERK13 [Hevea brasiliensis]